MLPGPLNCPDSRRSAAARMRSAGCRCAPAQVCWPAAGTVRLVGRLTGGVRRTGPVAPLPGGGGILPLPWRRGCGAAVPLAGLWLSVGWGGERGEGGRDGGSPLSPSGSPVLLSGGCGGAA